MTSKITTLAAAVIAVGLFAGSAMAANWPARVVGTWSAFANQSQLTITISSQGSSGGCRPISGTILDVASGITSNLVGFYCPGTGRFNFARNDQTTGTTSQDYSGNVSQRASIVYMGGVFAQLVSSGVGEYSFFAALLPPQRRR